MSLTHTIIIKFIYFCLVLNHDYYLAIVIATVSQYLKYEESNNRHYSFKIFIMYLRF